MEMWKCQMAHKPRPQPDEDSQIFWEGCRRHRLLIQQCEACGTFRFPPSPLCPACLSALVCWQDDPGEGEILTFCVYHAEVAGPAWQAELPYIVVVVELQYSGVKMLSNLEGVAPSAVRIGLPVRVVFRSEGDGLPQAKFVLSDDGAAG
ncbi:MAG: Zn-ribbon domain-containing OB-fold protein [Candidatus Tectimicrobiota bacterium]